MTEDQEQFVNELKERALKQSDLHKRASNYYRRLYYFMQILLIIISGITGTVSVNSSHQNLSTKKASNYLIVIGIIQIVSSILNGIQTVFRPGEFKRLHILLSNLYSKLYWDIKMEMSYLGTDKGTFRDISELAKTKVNWNSNLEHIQPPIPDLVFMPLWKVLLCMWNDKEQRKETENQKYEDEIEDLGIRAGVVSPNS